MGADEINESTVWGCGSYICDYSREIFSWRINSEESNSWSGISSRKVEIINNRKGERKFKRIKCLKVKVDSWDTEILFVCIDTRIVFNLVAFKGQLTRRGQQQCLQKGEHKKYVSVDLLVWAKNVAWLVISVIC